MNKYELLGLIESVVHACGSFVDDGDEFMGTIPLTDYNDRTVREVGRMVERAARFRYEMIELQRKLEAWNDPESIRPSGRS